MLQYCQRVLLDTASRTSFSRFIDVIFIFVYVRMCAFYTEGWLGSRVVSVLDSGTEGPGFKSQSRRCQVTVLGKLFTPIVPLFTKQRNWQQPF